MLERPLQEGLVASSTAATTAVFYTLGVGIRGTLGDIDPLNKVPFKRARSRAKKGPL